MGKSVFGRLSVFFSSSGSAMDRSKQSLLAVISPKCSAGNIGMQRKYVCYNDWQAGVSRFGGATIPAPRRIVPALATQLAEFCVYI